MEYIIFDLEATCWEGNDLGRDQEIIEIGALRLDAYGDVRSDFQCFVQPILHPRLSVYCQQLTGISQEDIDRAGRFDRVAEHFRNWLEDDGRDLILCSWGDKDLEMLMQDMALHQVSNGWMPPYIDLKDQYHTIKGIRKKRGLKRTLENEGFTFDGSLHRALDDARNLSQLFRKYLDVWMF